MKVRSFFELDIFSLLIFQVCTLMVQGPGLATRSAWQTRAWWREGSRLPDGQGGLGGVEGRLLPLRPRVRGCSLLGDLGGQGDGDRGLPRVRGCSMLGGGALRLAGDLGGRDDDGDRYATD